MKLRDLTEARYLSNYYLALWTDIDYWGKRGFIGATKAPVGEYDVTGETNELFRPDYSRFRHENSAGYVVVVPTHDQAEELAIELDVFLDDVLDSTRQKFGRLIGKHKDFESL